MHGFIKGRSCLSDLLIFQKSVIDMLDEGYSVDIIYLDLQKAFDKVPHDKLIGKIRGLGMNEKIVEWIENWLEDRMQRVGINGVFSEWAKVESGVPQGSILGPLLFNIFIMDINKKLKNKIIKFADDTKLWGKADTSEDIEGIREDLLQLSNWSKENKMPFNVSKCRVMHMGKKNNRESYKLMGEKIVETNEEKRFRRVFH